MNYQFEICANSVESCVAAQKAGAHRVELCASIPEGGTTPSYGEIVCARKYLDTTRLHVIIRPRGGDFLYSEQELEIMENDIDMVRQLGVDGVVFGILTADGEVDMPTMQHLMTHAEGMSVTFHRAFDLCRHPQQALEEIIALGCNRILTSGCANTAIQGANLLKQLNEQACGRIALMAGCGVNEQNIAQLAQVTGIHQFHFSARERVESSMLYRNDHVSMGGTVTIDEYSRLVTTSQRIAKTMDCVR